MPFMRYTMDPRTMTFSWENARNQTGFYIKIPITRSTVHNSFGSFNFEGIKTDGITISDYQQRLLFTTQNLEWFLGFAKDQKIYSETTIDNLFDNLDCKRLKFGILGHLNQKIMQKNNIYFFVNLPENLRIIISDLQFMHVPNQPYCISINKIFLDILMNEPIIERITPTNDTEVLVHRFMTLVVQMLRNKAKSNHDYAYSIAVDIINDGVPYHRDVPNNPKVKCIYYFGGFGLHIANYINKLYSIDIPYVAESGGAVVLGNKQYQQIADVAKELGL